MEQLSHSERFRFATYLEEQAASDDQMANQLEIIGAGEPMVKKLRVEAMAAHVIAGKLRSIEEESISE